ncbi:MAG: hypothetical protein M3N18_06455 [Actinomycetota bacterium]|nr:hypothetical protein [Actinomycetota bacterium]
MRDIKHEQVRVVLDRKARVPPDVERENKMANWAETLYKNAMLIAAAGVLAEEGSLEKAASVLWWAGFEVPAGYFPDGHEGALLARGDEEALRLWVQQEADRIEGANRTAGFYLAGTGQLMDDAQFAEDTGVPEPRGRATAHRLGGLRVVPDPAEEENPPTA